MSSFLYRLGQRTARHARAVARPLAARARRSSAATAAVFGGELPRRVLDPRHRVPGGARRARHPVPGGLRAPSGQVVFTAPRASRSPTTARRSRSGSTALEDVDHVLLVADPFAKENVALSRSPRTAGTRWPRCSSTPRWSSSTPRVVDEVEEVATDVDGPDARVSTSAGTCTPPTSVPVSITEAIGVGVALLVLVLTLGSLLAAGIPLLTAVLGVGITMAGVVTLASVFSINTSTPSLAMMIGLAVGIDYALFLVDRHRNQLRDGMEVDESVARSVATAGSAVIFAGVTVIIALCGLVVARIPFLSVMGLAGAAAVAVAVLIAVTLTPAMLSVAGERLRPEARRAAPEAARPAPGRAPAGSRW